MGEDGEVPTVSRRAGLVTNCKLEVRIIRIDWPTGLRCVRGHATELLPSIASGSWARRATWKARTLCFCIPEKLPRGGSRSVATTSTYEAQCSSNRSKLAQYIQLRVSSMNSHIRLAPLQSPS